MAQAEARGPQRMRRGSVTHSTNRENKVSKIFIIPLWLIGRAGKETSYLLKFNGPHSEIRPAKLTNQTGRTNYAGCRQRAARIKKTGSVSFFFLHRSRKW